MAYDKMPRIHVKPESRPNAMHYCPPSMDRSIRVGQKNFKQKVNEYYDKKPEIQAQIDAVKVSNGEMQDELRKLREQYK